MIIIFITMILIFEGKTMVDEGEVRKGKTGGSVVCYRGAWLPQVIIIVDIIVIVIVLRWGDMVASVLVDCPFAQHRTDT